MTAAAAGSSSGMPTAVMTPRGSKQVRPVRRRAGAVPRHRDVDDEAVVVEVGSERRGMRAAIGRHRGDEVVGARLLHVVDDEDLETFEAGCVPGCRVDALAGTVEVVVGQILGPVDRAHDDLAPHDDVPLAAVALDLSHVLRLSGRRDVDDTEAVVAPLVGVATLECEVAVDLERRRVEERRCPERLAEGVDVLGARILRVIRARGEHEQTERSHGNLPDWRLAEDRGSRTAAAIRA
ncbi:MAG TPA: hypothetical protein VK915_02305 [Gaiellaceae bacterium]|nr:hypothetical protein [Gaiellaceae bacterium]